MSDNIKNLLYRVKQYIENREATVEAEFGRGRSIEQLIDDKAMPALYYEVCATISELEGKA